MGFQKFLGPEFAGSSPEALKPNWIDIPLELVKISLHLKHFIKNPLKFVIFYTDLLIIPNDQWD